MQDPPTVKCFNFKAEENQLFGYQAKQDWEEQQEERQAAAGNEDTEEAEKAEQFVAYVPLPSDQELEQRILQVKKANLLAKYTSEAIQREQAEAKALLNKQ